jgi:hypothetical protein
VNSFLIHKKHRKLVEQAFGLPCPA